MGTGKQVSVLIVDGMNNHDWKRTSASIKEILLHSGMFSVDVSTTPTDDAPDSEWDAWNPTFSKYDVTITNFNGGHLPEHRHFPERVRKSLEKYLGDGGGLVILHAANNAFGGWPAYNEMVGLAWRDRDFGSTVIVDGDKQVVIVPPNEGSDAGHGPDHEFVVEVLKPDHPICQGLPAKWLHASDQLSHGQRGPAKNMTVLTFAYDKYSDANQPMEWTIPYGKGRVFTSLLGHIWDGARNTSVRCVGFQTTFIRGVEWAATGSVTYPVPENFPTPDAILLTDVPAEEKDTRMDFLDNHSRFYWTGRGGAEHEWTPVESVALDPEDSTRFVAEPGIGVFYNGPNGRTADLYTVWEHADCELHIEFNVPKGSNSGVYFMGRYEVQILDSWGAEGLEYGTCGGIYARWINEKAEEGNPPRVNMSRAPGEWQTFDISFRAPRFDADGNKLSNATFVKVVWNGEVVQENVEISGPTRAAMLEDEAPQGPLMLQGDHGPVALRNIILKPVYDA